MTSSVTGRHFTVGSIVVGSFDIRRANIGTLVNRYRGSIIFARFGSARVNNRLDAGSVRAGTLRVGSAWLGTVAFKRITVGSVSIGSFQARRINAGTLTVRKHGSAYSMSMGSAYAGSALIGTFRSGRGSIRNLRLGTLRAAAGTITTLNITTGSIKTTLAGAGASGRLGSLRVGTFTAKGYEKAQWVPPTTMVAPGTRGAYLTIDGTAAPAWLFVNAARRIVQFGISPPPSTGVGILELWYVAQSGGANGSLVWATDRIQIGGSKFLQPAGTIFRTLTTRAGLGSLMRARIQISGSQGNYIAARVMREGTAAGDTWSGSALLLGVKAIWRS